MEGTEGGWEEQRERKSANEGEGLSEEEEQSRRENRGGGGNEGNRRQRGRRFVEEDSAREGDEEDGGSEANKIKEGRTRVKEGGRMENRREEETMLAATREGERVGDERREKKGTRGIGENGINDGVRKRELGVSPEEGTKGRRLEDRKGDEGLKWWNCSRSKQRKGWKQNHGRRTGGGSGSSNVGFGGWKKEGRCGSGRMEARRCGEESMINTWHSGRLR